MAMLLGAGLVVKLVLFTLIMFSIISWSIIIFKLYQVHHANRQSDKFLELFWHSKGFDVIADKVNSMPGSPLKVLFNEAYGELKKISDGRNDSDESIFSVDLGGVENVSRALHRATNLETTRLERYITFLATTGSTSPFIGLFGTVWGIMTAFEGIGKTGSASLAVVAPGIAEALIATAIGLVAAIPAVMAYNHFQHKIRVLINEMESFSTEFLNIVQRNINGR